MSSGGERCEIYVLKDATWLANVGRYLLSAGARSLAV